MSLFSHAARLCLLYPCCSTIPFFPRCCAISTFSMMLHYDYFFHAAALCIFFQAVPLCIPHTMMLHYDFFFHAAALCLPFPFCSCAMSTFSTQLRFVYFFYAAPLRLLSCADPRIFVRGGGVQVNPTKKALTTFFLSSPHLTLPKSNGLFQRKKIIFQGSGGGSIFFQVCVCVCVWGGGVQLFPGRGSNCLFPIEPHITCDFHGGLETPAPPPSGSALDFFHFSHAAVVCLLFHAAPPPPPPPPPTTIPRSAHTCIILHIMFMYIYRFLVSWNGREFDYWHTNSVGSVFSAAHTFYVTPTSQRACAIALLSLFSTVSVFYVTPVLSGHSKKTNYRLMQVKICHVSLEILVQVSLETVSRAWSVQPSAKYFNPHMPSL